MRLFVNINCPICGSDSCTHTCIYTREFKNHGPEVVRCNVCNCVYLNPVMSEEEYKKFYDNDEQRKFVVNCIGKPLYNNIDNRRRYNIIKKYCNKNSNILDVGAGPGYLVKYLSNFYSNACGIDISASRVLEAQYNNIRVENINLFEFNRSVDAITLIHVLEHISKPDLFINRLSDLLVKDGLLFVEVPNHNDLLLINKHYKKFYYQNAHCIYYDPETLLSLMSQKFKLVKNIPTQRYLFDNHLHWLIKSGPGKFLHVPYMINKVYEMCLKKTKYYDTIFMIFRKK